MTSIRTFATGCALCALFVLGPVARAQGDDIRWVGYQGCAEGSPAASFFSGDNWFNYLVPDREDRAVFGSGFDPQENGMPHEIHLGDFCLDVFGCPNTYYFPADTARVLELLIQNEDWTFDMDWGGWQGCFPPELRDGVLEAGRITVGSQVWETGEPGDADVTFRDGDIFADDVAIGPDEGSTGRLALVGSETSLTCRSHFDVWRGVARIAAGARLDAFVVRAGDGNPGFTRYLVIRDTGTFCDIEHLAIGNGGSGRVEISGGADVECGFLKMGDYGGEGTSCLVTGPGTTLRFRGDTYMPLWTDALFEVADRAAVLDLPSLNAQHARVRILDGALFETDHAVLAIAGEPAEVEVTGAGSLWTIAAWLNVGESGDGVLAIRNGGEVEAGWVRIPGPDSGSGRATVEGSGSVLRAAGEIRVGDLAPGILEILDGAVVEAHPLIVGHYGSVEGDGIVQGDLANGNVVAPGASPGVLDVDGSYTQTAEGRLQIEIGGLEPGLGHDQLRVTGSAQVAGVLEIMLVDYVPPSGTEFEILSAGAVAGRFDEIVSADGHFAVDYETSRVVITYLDPAEVPAGSERRPPAFDFAVTGAHPFRAGDPVRLALDASAASGRVRFDLMSVDGRLVGSWDAGPSARESGTFTLPAAALDTFESGVYMLRMQSPGMARTRRIVVIR